MVRLGFYLFHRGLFVPSIPSGAHDVGQSFEDDVLGAASLGDDTVYKSFSTLASCHILVVRYLRKELTRRRTRA